MKRAFPKASRSLAGLVLLAALTACAGDERPVVASGAAPPECRSREGGSRWAADGGYVEAGTFGRDPELWLEAIAGVAELGGRTYVYDAGRTQVMVLDDSLRPVRMFGRRGKGPGELEPGWDRGMRGRGWRWLEVVDSSVMVFDGFRLQSFAPDGSLRRGRFQGPVRRGAVHYMADRLRVWDGAIISASGGSAGLSGGPRPYEWTLSRSTEFRTAPILSLQLTPPPKSRGVPFTGPEQARPLWDAANGCVIAGDGTGRWLVRGGVNGGPVDTLALRLPDLPRPKVNVEALERLMGASSKGRGGGYVKPTAVKDVEALIIDPDGYAWILPVQDSTAGGDGVEVVRMTLQTGETVRDTVPAFPMAFGDAGEFYARLGGRDDPILARYRLRAATRPR